ncbi:MAG: D-cysteine desulfhydrase family protein [Deltaproteobacteria bacterium]|nr:MAG: D-cysteine desulfhydrase family protein [Deltaproteobacteria bacterium]
MDTISHRIPYPPRLALAHTPTPLEPLKRLGETLGVELYFKRDDLTGAELTGNKVRKLEFLLADALDKGADSVVTCGAAQSNHARATAIAAVKVGLSSRLLLRTPDPAHPPSLEGNILLDRLAGAEIVWISYEQYGRRAEMFQREAESLRKVGKTPYLIPEGGSNALGAWGYVRTVEELANDLETLPGGTEQPTTIVHATGSGGTTAGLILGVQLTGLQARVVGINVCNDRDYFVRVVGDICETALSDHQLDLPFKRERDVEILDGYVGRGYGKTRPQELSLLRDLARTEGIFLDPVYTGKAFFGMARELQQDPDVFGERVVFIHTGGIYGLFPMAEQMAALL